jgi:hypothetical protein
LRLLKLLLPVFPLLLLALPIEEDHLPLSQDPLVAF